MLRGSTRARPPPPSGAARLRHCPPHPQATPSHAHLSPRQGRLRPRRARRRGREPDASPAAAPRATHAGRPWPGVPAPRQIVPFPSSGRRAPCGHPGSQAPTAPAANPDVPVSPLRMQAKREAAPRPALRSPGPQRASSALGRFLWAARPCWREARSERPRPLTMVPAPARPRDPGGGGDPAPSPRPRPGAPRWPPPCSYREQSRGAATASRLLTNRRPRREFGCSGCRRAPAPARPRPRLDDED